MTADNILDAVGVFFLVVIFCAALYSYLNYHALYKWATVAMLMIFGIRTFGFYWADSVGLKDVSSFVNGSLARCIEWGLGAALMLLDFYMIHRKVKEFKELDNDQELEKILEENTSGGSGNKRKEVITTNENP